MGSRVPGKRILEFFLSQLLIRLLTGINQFGTEYE